MRLRPGEELALGRPATGVRTYLAVRGGLGVPAVLGSRSRDTGSGLGPAPLAAGDVLPVGTAAASRWAAWFGPVPSPSAPFEQPAVVELAPGPHDDLAGDPRAAGRSPPTATGSACGWWAGRRCCAACPASLPSFPVLPGSVQVTPAGELLVLGPDAGVTGGYPVVGVVTGSSLDRLAQCRPGRRGGRPAPDATEPRSEDRGSVDALKRAAVRLRRGSAVVACGRRPRGRWRP